VKIDVVFETSDQLSETAVREDLILEILRLAESLGIEFASPTRVIQLAPPSVATRVPASHTPRSAGAA
jgi:hypothetical protein